MGLFSRKGSKASASDMGAVGPGLSPELNADDASLVHVESAPSASRLTELSELSEVSSMSEVHPEPQAQPVSAKKRWTFGRKSGTERLSERIADVSDAQIMEGDSLREETTAPQVDRPRMGLLSGRKKSESVKTSHALPIRILIGFLPEVTEKDARDYALGVAERHFDQPAIAFYDAFKYGDGYAYEVHEGGEGQAYLPKILEYFDSLGPFAAGEDTRVVIQTGTRKVQVNRARNGIAALLLPDSSTEPVTDWLVPEQKMAPALNKRTGFLVVGAVFFVTGFFAVILSSTLTRIQPYTPPPQAGVETISYESLPISQWPRLLNLAPNTYVSKLVFENKKWQRPEVRSADTRAVVSEPEAPKGPQPIRRAPAPSAAVPQ